MTELPTPMSGIIRIDETLCRGCGECVRQCVGGSLSIVNNKLEYDNAQCIMCGGCEAVCPSNAISLKFDDTVAIQTPNSIEFEQHAQDPQKKGPITAVDAVQQRRSYRCFKPEPVPQELLTRLLNETRYAPSAKNARGVQFAVLSRSAMEEILPVVMETVPHIQQLEPHGLETYDRIFHGAPQVLLAVSPQLAAHEDAIIALTTFELIAQANGLATLWSGALKQSAALSTAVKDTIGLPAELDLCGALCVGFPDITYLRPPTRRSIECIFCE